MEYFSSINKAQLPDRRYMFCVLATLRFMVLNNMVQRVCKIDQKKSQQIKMSLFTLSKKIMEKIMAVASYKCKIIFAIIWILVSKGRASQMLKRSTKLFIKRKQPKIYPLHIENLKKDDDEEEMEENDMS